MPGKMDEYCKENNFVGWYETSARDNINIEESAKALVARVKKQFLMNFRNFNEIFSTFTDTHE
jgi:hypothetical protein